MAEITTKGCKCDRCKHEWTPRIFNGKMKKPKVCPKCHSPYWNSARETK